MVRASVRTALLVGTVLTIINQWGAWRQHGIGLQLLGRVAFNYLVPFLVAAYSRSALSRSLLLERVAAGSGS